MDTVITVSVYDKHYKESSGIVEECIAIADHYDQLLTASLDTSDISRINASGGEPTEVEKDTYDLIAEACRYAEDADGVIDPTVLPVSRLWGFYGIDQNRTMQVPDPDELKEALSHVGYQNILMEEKDGHYFVTLKDPETQIELGFIAKGYIADRMKEFLLSKGIKSAILNLGGNVLLVGSKPDKSDFRLDLEGPRTAGSPVAPLEVSDVSVVTSGIYQRNFTQDGVFYHHILDTKTGYPADSGVFSVTIISPTSVQGDALSTTLLVLGVEKGLEKIESLPECEALFVTTDGQLYYSSGFPK